MAGAPQRGRPARVRHDTGGQTPTDENSLRLGPSAYGAPAQPDDAAAESAGYFVAPVGVIPPSRCLL